MFYSPHLNRWGLFFYERSKNNEQRTDLYCEHRRSSGTYRKHRASGLHHPPVRELLSANGSVINIREPGYYDVDISATFTAAAAGDVTLTLLQDGVPVPGATATSTITTATTQVENSAIMATVRVMCCGNSNLSVLVGGTAAPTISNMAVQVTKI